MKEYKFECSKSSIKFDSSNILNNQLNKFMRTPILLIVTFTLLVATRADYFAGVVTDQQLATNTTNAINDLKATLIADFDCSDSSRTTSLLPLGGILNLGSLNLFGQPRTLFSISQALFKKNNDRTVYTYNNPIKKISFQIFGGITKKYELYNKCTYLARLLAKIKEMFKNYNNVIIGEQNVVNGNNNWVVGSRDSITGNNNWVFTSDLNLETVEDGVLIIGNYLIELVDINLILLDPSQAIRCLTTEDSNSKFRYWWGNVPNYRKTCF